MAAVSVKAQKWVEYKMHDKDTGSTKVQIVRLTRRIELLSTHCSDNHCDKHALLGLVKLLSKRRKLLKYLASKSHTEHAALLGELGIRK